MPPSRTTSVKMRHDDKVLLDRIQARLTDKTGEKVAHQEILHRLMRHAERHLEVLLEEEPSNEEIEADLRALQALPEETGQRLRHDEIDDIVYGD